MHPAVRAGALLTAGYLAGGLILALLPSLVVDALPLPVPLKDGVAAILALAVVTLAGAGWGRALAGLAGSAEIGRLRLAGGLGFGPVVIAAGVALGAAEPSLVAQGRDLGAATHTVYAAVFTAAMFCVAAVSGGAVGVGLRDRRLALRLGLGAGTAAAAAFLLVALGMDAVGWRVGAPDAARRATMLMVTAIGVIAASCAGGAAIGRSLATVRQRHEGSA